MDSFKWKSQIKKLEKIFFFKQTLANFLLNYDPKLVETL